MRGHMIKHLTVASCLVAALGVQAIEIIYISALCSQQRPVGAAAYLHVHARVIAGCYLRLYNLTEDGDATWQGDFR